MKKTFTRFMACLLAFAVMLSYSFIGHVADASAIADKGVTKVKIANVKSGKLTIGKGKKLRLNAKIVLKKGSKASKKLIYQSAKPSIASVSKSGVIKAKKIGKTKITVKSKANPKKKAVITVVVAKKNIKVKKISMKKTLTLYMDTGDEDEDDLDDEEETTLEESDTSDDSEDAAEEEEDDEDEEDEDEDDTVLYEGDDDTYELDYKVLPSNATNQTLKWSSSNKKVVTVDNNGVVTMVGVGKAVVTAKSTDGTKKKAACTITVKPDDE